MIICPVCIVVNHLHINSFTASPPKTSVPGSPVAIAFFHLLYPENQQHVIGQNSNLAIRGSFLFGLPSNRPGQVGGATLFCSFRPATLESAHCPPTLSFNRPCLLAPAHRHHAGPVLLTDRPQRQMPLLLREVDEGARGQSQLQEERRLLLTPWLELGPQQKTIYFCLVSGKQRGPQKRKKKKATNSGKDSEPRSAPRSEPRSEPRSSYEPPPFPAPSAATRAQVPAPP